jgi:hypothetical protein
VSGDRGPTIQLCLLRHADAGDPEAWAGDDAERPLSPKGEAQAERLATFLHGVRFGVDAVISSPLIRAGDRRDRRRRARGERPPRRSARGPFELATIDEIWPIPAHGAGRLCSHGRLQRVLSSLTGSSGLTMKGAVRIGVAARGERGARSAGSSRRTCSIATATRGRPGGQLGG